MFPLPFNIPFRKKDGTLSTLGDELNNGGGSSYTLPTASADVKGGVKIGDGLTMDGEVLKNLNPTPYTLPTASAEVLGGVKIGEGLTINENGVLSASGGGGVTIKTLKITLSGISIPANSFLATEVQPTALYNKTVLGAYSDGFQLGVCLARVEDWNNKKIVDIVLFNASTGTSSPSKFYVTYVD